jgi:hypothetical protein
MVVTKSFEDLKDADLAERLKNVDQPSPLDVAQIAATLVGKRRATRRRRTVGLSLVVSSCFLLGWLGIRGFFGSLNPDLDHESRVAVADREPNLVDREPNLADREQNFPPEVGIDKVEIDFANIDQLLNASVIKNDLWGRTEVEKNQREKIEELKNEIELMEERNDRYRRSVLREIASRAIQ